MDSGIAAIDEIRRADAAGKPYDVALLDWQMPHMDGIETAGNIRRLPVDPLPRLLLVTAFGRKEVFREASQAGLEHVLVKPVCASTMFNTLVDVLKGPGDGTAIKEQLPSESLPQFDAIKGASILLVDDNAFNRQLAFEILKDAVLRIDLAENGQDAIEMLGKRLYDAVLMDMQMPVMDGLAATREIRKNEQFRDLPIIAMTANVMAADIQKCLDSGMNDHIGKPIDPQDLFRKLVAWVRSAWSRSARTRPSRTPLNSRPA